MTTTVTKHSIRPVLVAAIVATAVLAGLFATVQPSGAVVDGRNADGAHHELVGERVGERSGAALVAAREGLQITRDDAHALFQPEARLTDAPTGVSCPRPRRSA